MAFRVFPMRLMATAIGSTTTSLLAHHHYSYANDNTDALLPQDTQDEQAVFSLYQFVQKYLGKLPEYKDWGRFDDINRESKEMLDFDVPNGLQFEVQKPVADPAAPMASQQTMLLYRHVLNLGSSEERGGTTYEFQGQFLHSIDSTKQVSVSTQFAKNSFFNAISLGVGRNFTSVIRLQSAKGPMGEQRSMGVQLDGKVADAWLGLNLMNRGVVLSYLQPIHPRCALGGTFIGTEDQSMLIGAARYEDARNFSVLMGQTVGDHDKLTLWNGMAYTLSFGRKISPDFSMITSGMFYPEQMNTRYSVGLKYVPSQDKSFKVSYNEDGKISSVMETPVKIGAFGFKLTIGSEINHFKNEYHSGMSISIG